MENREKELELRMYFFVPYQLTGIQQAIQAGHASLEYAREYSETILFKEFVDNHKTWIILNGGTTNNDPKLLGTLNESYKSILEFNQENAEKIDFSLFYEPDLNDALTAVCFICDERVFNYEDYPDIAEFAFKYMMKNKWLERFKNGPYTYEDIKESHSDIYIEWEKSLGGPKNVFLRNLLKGKKLA